MCSIVPPSSITDHHQAVDLARRIAAVHARADVAVVLDPWCRVIDLAVRAADDRPIPPIRWLHTVGRPAGPGAPQPMTDATSRWRPAGLLLLSIGGADPTAIRESDLERFRRARRSAAAAGLSLVDWIEIDGDVVRSFARLVGPEHHRVSGVDGLGPRWHR